MSDMVPMPMPRPIMPTPVPDVTPILPYLPYLQMAVILALLVWASASDLRRRIIPNGASIGIALAGLLHFHPLNLLGALAAIPLLCAAVISKNGEGIGGGDIKLTAAAGSLLGFYGGVAGLVFGLSAFLIYTLIRAAARKLAGLPDPPLRQLSLPMAPFLSLGFFAVYLNQFGGTML